MQLGFFFHMQLALAGPAGAASTAAAAAVAGAPAAASGHVLFGALSAAAAAAGVTITRPIAFATAFMLLFSVVIALFKDIPDVAGDSQVGRWVGLGGWGWVGWVGGGGWRCCLKRMLGKLGAGVLEGLELGSPRRVCSWAPALAAVTCQHPLCWPVPMVLSPGWLDGCVCRLVCAP